MPSGKAIARFLIPSCERDIESQTLKDALPEWIKEIVIEVIHLLKKPKIACSEICACQIFFFTIGKCGLYSILTVSKLYFHFLNLANKKVAHFKSPILNPVVGSC